MRHRGRLRAIGHFVAAVVATTTVGTIIQTQINLDAIQALGVDVPTFIRLRTTGEDLLGFSPTLAGLATAALLPALPFTLWLTRRIRRLSAVIFGLAGWCALLAALFIADAVAPMPTLIAATRSLAGALAVAASGALGAWLFYRLHEATHSAMSGASAPASLAGGHRDD